jgi:SurA-like N-terminal domain
VTRYFKSRHADRPAIFVQEEGQWRGYAPGGMVQRSTGSIPEAIRAHIVEITREEAEALVAGWKAEADKIRQKPTGTAGPPEAAGPNGVATASGVAAAAAATPITATGPSPAAAPAGAGTAAAGAGTAAATSAGTAMAAETPRTYAVPSRARSGRPRWMIYSIAGGAAIIVIAVLVTLALTGVFGGGSDTQTGATGPGSSTTIKATGAAAKVLATVGGHKIIRQQLDQRIAEFKAQYPGEVPDPQTEPDQYKIFEQYVLDYLVTYELASQKADELKIAVTDQDLQTQIDLIRQISYGGDQAKFDAALEEQGMTMAQFAQIYRESMLFRKVYAEVTKGVATPTAAEIQAYYDEHATDTYAGKSFEQVKDDIESALLEARQKAAWQQWVEQARAKAGVTYADDWKPTATTGAPLP